MSLAFRDATPNEINMVVSNWLSSYRKSEHAGLIQLPDWFAVMDPQLRKLLARPRVRVLVAYDPGDDGGRDAYGWIAFEPGNGKEYPIVHYVYIKELYRRKGLASALFAQAGIDPLQPMFITCANYRSRQLRAKIPAARFKPLIARETR